MPTRRPTSARSSRSAASRRTRRPAPANAEPAYVDLSATVSTPLTLWIVVGALSAVVLIAWIWQVSSRVLDLSRDGLSLSEQAQRMLGQDQPAVPAVAGDIDVAALKDEVLATIEEQLGVRAWPVYDAASVGISIKYPSTWFVRERDGLLVIATYPAATNTPERLAQASISREANPTRLTPEEWFSIMRSDRADYALATTTASTTIAGFASAWYQQQGVDSADAHWVVYAAASSTMYTIDLYSRRGREEYLNGLLQIPPTLRLITATTTL